jgi:phospholipid transport system substrate-binding protein
MTNSIQTKAIASRFVSGLITSAASVTGRGSANGFLLCVPYVRARVVVFARRKLFAIATAAAVISLFTVVLLSSAGAPVPTAPAPVAQVRTTIAEASPVFANRHLPNAVHDRLLRVIADKHFDFSYMAKSALGAYWKNLSPKQQRQFVPLFEDYVLATYLTTLQHNTVEAASRALKDNVTYENTETAAVISEVQLEMVQDPLDVKYLLHKNGRRWKLYDIVVDNVSTIANYRDQFNELINREGYDKLIAGLKAKDLSPAR